MADTTDVPPLSWLFAQTEQRRTALRYWVRDPLVGAVYFVLYVAGRLMTIDFCSNFGAAVTRFTRHIYPESDARARDLWRKLRPEAADEASVDAAMDRLWRNVGRTMHEFSVLDRLWADGRIEVEGANHLHALRAANQPILGAALHLGNWEVIPVTGVSLGYYGASLAVIQENRFLQRLAERIRKRFGGRMIFARPSSGRAIVRQLRERGPMLIYIDEFIRDRVNAPAFGRPLKAEGNISYVIRLAKMTGAAIVPIYCIRLNDTAHFKVTILPPVPLADSGDATADLMANIATLNSIIEPIIRAHLDQWFFALDFEFNK